MTGDQHIKRFNAMKTDRRFIEPFWRKAFESTFPLRGALIGHDAVTGELALSAAEDAAAQIYDSTLRDSCSVLAATLQAGMCPSNSLWFDFNIKTQDQAGKAWLGDFAKFLWENIHECNFDTAGFEAYMDYVVAMACVFIDEGDLSEGKLYNFKPWPIHSCYFADSTGRGIIDTCYRPYSLSAEQAVNEFKDPRYPLSEKVRKAAENEPDKRFRFVHAVFPNRTDKSIKFPIASEHVEMDTRRLVRKSGFPEQPFAVMRWLPVPDSVYSAGPAENGMPDHKTLNEMIKFVLANADLAIAGMWGAVEDGALMQGQVTVGPRKIIWMQNKESFFPLKSGANFDVSSLEMNRMQRQIRRGMKADQLHPEEPGKEMTKYEVQQRVQLINRQLAPMFSRLNPEFLNVMIRRCAGIALRSGMVPPAPQSIQNRLTQITYRSPLARSQKVEEIQAMDAFEERVLLAAKEGVPGPLDLYDIDEAYRQKSELLGVPQSLIRSKDDVTKIRRQRQDETDRRRKEMQDQALREKIAPTAAKGAMNG